MLPGEVATLFGGGGTASGISIAGGCDIIGGDSSTAAG